MLVMSILSLLCPACGQLAVSRLGSLRPPVLCSDCGASLTRDEHPLADALELLGPPFFVVSILISFFNWSLWPTGIVVALWLLASARIPLVAAADSTREKN